jgi:hypothetical protein
MAPFIGIAFRTAITRKEFQFAQFDYFHGKTGFFNLFHALQQHGFGIAVVPMGSRNCDNGWEIVGWHA